MREAARRRGVESVREPAPRPAGQRSEAEHEAHRAILRALGLPPFVSPRTLRMIVGEVDLTGMYSPGWHRL